MIWGYCAFILILIIIIIIVYKLYYGKTETEPFLLLNNADTIFNSATIGTGEKDPPTEIQYQIPVPVNQLSDNQLTSIDSDVLRNVRRLANFSMTDEFDFYQMYNLINKQKKATYTFTYDPSTIDKKSHIISSDKLVSINSGAIDNNITDLELFSRLKLELISAFNNLVITNNYYTPYHPFQFFKIINSNMISSKYIDNIDNTMSSRNVNYVFILTFAREYKYQQFNIYYDIDLIMDNTPNQYIAKINKIELIGIPIPRTIQFHANQKTTDKPDILNDGLGALSSASLQVNQNDIIKLISKNSSKMYSNDGLDSSSSGVGNKDFYYKDQVSDSAAFDVMPNGDPSIRFQSPDVKYIDLTERSDMDQTTFDTNSLAGKIEDKIMNIARDQQFNNHRCYGLVNGVSQELPQYKNPVFCRSFHPEINQNGIWDAPCQVNSDCPFYKANKNYPNEFGKCNKVSGQCEMPLGIVPIGFSKYARSEPNCYNCGTNSEDSKCCGVQSNDIKNGKNMYKSPDYVFTGDETYRKQFADELKSLGLLVNPSI